MIPREDTRVTFTNDFMAVAVRDKLGTRLEILKVKGEIFMRDVFEEINSLIRGEQGWMPKFGFCPRCSGMSWESLKTYAHCGACLHFEDYYEEPFHLDRDIEKEIKERSKAGSRRASKLTPSQELIADKSFPMGKDSNACQV